MTDLRSTIAATLLGCYTAHAAKIRELADPLSNEQFWRKPFPFGNSFGHLILHLTGNLNYYIGAQIAATGYIRDRDREFTESAQPSKEQSLQRLDDAVAMVVQTIRAQSSDDWSLEYTGKGSDARTRLEMVVQCAGHMQHHIGQMIYLSNMLRQESEAA